MATALDGEVILVTGGGIGRDIALMAAAEGAAAVVNDLGASLNGIKQTDGAALKVVEEIRLLAAASPTQTPPAPWSKPQ